jgi:hypothetical protein
MMVSRRSAWTFGSVSRTRFVLDPARPRRYRLSGVPRRSGGSRCSPLASQHESGRTRLMDTDQRPVVDTFRPLSRKNFGRS